MFHDSDPFPPSHGPGATYSLGSYPVSPGRLMEYTNTCRRRYYSDVAKGTGRLRKIFFDLRISIFDDQSSQ
jgi:hypothetical protein